MKRRIFVLLTAILFVASAAMITGCKKKKEPVVAISLDRLTIEMEVGDAAVQLTATVENSTDAVVWTIAPAGVATVSKNASDSKKALVTAVRKGTATITASVGDKSATCAVTVTEPDPEAVSIKLDADELTLRETSPTGTLTAAVKNSAAAVVWTTSDSGVATVQASASDSKQATVTMVAPGTATITATVEGKAATCVVTVAKPDEVQKYFDKTTTFRCDLDEPFELFGMMVIAGAIFDSSTLVFDTHGGYVMTSYWGSFVVGLPGLDIDPEEPIIKTGPYELNVSTNEFTWTYDDEETTLQLVSMGDCGCLKFDFILPTDFGDVPLHYYTSHDLTIPELHFSSYFPYPEEILGVLNAFDDTMTFTMDKNTAGTGWEFINKEDDFVTVKILFNLRGAYKILISGIALLENGSYSLVEDNGDKYVRLAPVGEDNYDDYSLTEVPQPPPYDYNNYYILEYKGARFYSDDNRIPTVVLTGISVGGTYKTEYFVGEEFDDTGIVVTAEYSDGSTAIIPISQCDFDLNGSFASAGTVEVIVYYNEISASFNVTVNAVVVDSIAISGSYKTEYFVGEEFDDTGIVVTAEYNDGSTAIIPISQCDFDLNGSFASAGTVEVIVYYNEISASFNVTVSAVVVDSIAISGSYKTSYFAGDAFNNAGIIVTATYNNGSTAVIPIANCSVAFDGSFASAGTVKVTITYNGKTAFFNATVNAVVVDSIAISGSYKTSYFAGDAFNNAGIIVTATYNNGSTADIPIGNCDITFDGSFASAGTVKVTITYNGKTASFNATVNAVVLDSIAISGSYKTNYFAGDAFNNAGIIVTATYNNGSTSVISLGECSVTFDGSFASAGTVRVTITYNGKADYFDVIVTALIVNSITISGTYQTEYYVGESFNNAGIVVTAYYNNGTNEPVGIAFCDVTFSSAAAGPYTVTVAFQGKEDTFNINVSTVAVTGIAINKDAMRLGMYVMVRSTTYTPVWTVYPSNATNKNVTWTVTSVTGVSINATTGVVTTSGSAAYLGQPVVTVTSADGSFTDSFTIYIVQNRLTGATLTPSTLNLYVGAVGNVGSTGTLTSGTSQSSTTNAYRNGYWVSSDPTVVTVSDAGANVAYGAQTLTALKAGTATVTWITIDGGTGANASTGFTASCEVTVLPFVPAASVSLNNTSLSLGAGGNTATLTATVLPSGTTNKAVVWSSSNPTVAEVDQTGIVTPLTVGTAIIKATSVDGAGSVFGECEVEVTAPVAVTGIAIDKSDMRMDIYVMSRSATYTPSVTISPLNASNKKVIWTISALSGLTINATTGTLTTASNATSGTATVTVTTEDGSFTDSFTVRVSQNRATGASFSGSVTTMNLYLGAFEDVGLTGTLTSTVAGTATGLYTNGYWASSDPTVATVTNAGLNVAAGLQTIKALKVGTTTITFTAIDGGFVATCTVTVAAFTPATSVALDKAYLLLGAEVETYTLTATVSPSETTNKKVIWSSSNPTVATVDQNGKVTPLAAGTAYIRATSVDGAGIFDECEVEVFAAIKVTGITLDKNEHVMGRSQTFQLTATIAPGDATNKKVVWSVTSATGVTIDQNGLLTTSSSATYGSVTVTATTDDGSFKATCLVYVAQTRLTGANFGSTTTMTLRIGAVGNMGSTGTLTSAIAPTSGSNRYTNGIWASSDPTVATVSNAGVSVAAGAQTITALKVGTTTITFTTIDGGFVASCTITVLDFIPAATLTLSENTLELKADIETATLTANIGPSDATNKGVIWSSSNTAVATVDVNGKVAAIAVGTAIIRATSVDGAGIFDECTVTVLTSIRVEGVKISYGGRVYENNDILVLTVSTTAQLTAIIDPLDASLQTVTWTSMVESGTNRAPISATGLITAGSSAGLSYISATTVDGGKTIMIRVQVATAANRVTSISINETALTLNAGNDYKGKVTATILPSGATVKEVIWISSDPNIAKVDSSGNVFATGVSGTVVISARSADGYILSATTCTVTLDVGFIPVTSVTFTQMKLTLYTGNQIPFADLATLVGIEILPLNATNRNIVWSSTGVLYWDTEQSYISLSEPGTGNIVAVAEGGNIVTICAVTVEWLPYDPLLMRTSAEITAGAEGLPGIWFNETIAMTGTYLFVISVRYEFYDNGIFKLWMSGAFATAGHYTIINNGDGTQSLRIRQFNDLSITTGALTQPSGKWRWVGATTVNQA